MYTVTQYQVHLSLSGPYYCLVRASFAHGNVALRGHLKF